MTGSTDSESHRRRFPWRTALLLGTVLALAGIAAFVYLRTLQHAGGIADRFKTGRITETFVQHIPTVASTHGDVLEVATAESEELFTKTDTLSVFSDAIYLGTTTSEVRVPVTHRYHVRLSGPWKLATRDRTCVVIAPQLRPSLPPAIHTDRMTKRTEAGWLRFNAQQNLDELERSITPQLIARATDSKHLALVREAARQSVAEFVKNWLLREGHWRADRFSSITVLFEDEAGAADPIAAPTLLPTLKM